MTKEQAYLLGILSEELTGRPDARTEMAAGLDWDALLSEARAQAVGLMAAEGVLRRVKDLPNAGDWQQLADRILSFNVRVSFSQDEMIRLLGDHPYFILKGMAAAAYYAHPYQRRLGDVDFLIDPKEQAELTELFEQNGYENNDTENPCHVVFKKPGAHLEMHFEIAGIPYGEPGEKVRSFMTGAVYHKKKVSFEGWDFFAPEDLYHGAVILLHMQHHMLGEGIGLRHLCDWAAYVERTANEAFWPTLLDFFRSIGLFTYAAAMTRTCHLYLKTACPSWAANTEDDLCRDLIEDILSVGNFGRKDPERAAGGLLISQHGKEGTERSMVKNAWQTLVHSVELHYPAVKEKPLLWGIYLPKRAFQLLRRIRTGNIAIRPASVRAGKERRDVYERLHIFETGEGRK